MKYDDLPASAVLTRHLSDLYLLVSIKQVGL